MSEQEQSALSRKSEANRRAYAKSKSRQDHVLLRLDAGGAARLDAAARAASLSRAAFARLFLGPLLDALGTRLPEIERARALGRQSFTQFLARAIDDAVARSAEPQPAAPPSAASEFDALFGSADD
jgi:hypothetical protein